jgi:glutathione synthase
MRFLFVMDRAHTMLPDKDTSFAFMRSARAKGHECLHCVPTDVFNVGSDVSARARTIAVSDEPPHVVLGDAEDVAARDVDAIFIRKDPPFDDSYLWLTQQLDLARRDTLVLNDPTGVRDANEKLFTMRFAHLMPKTLVTAHPDRLIAFVREVGGQAIVKPLDGAGGSGVLRVSEGDPNTRSIVDLTTREGKRLAMVQEFLPSVRDGDKRVLMLAGEPLGVIQRVPRADEFRANIHVGGTVVRTELTDNEERLAREVGKTLVECGLWFVGLDLIAERLIEVNVTSPTGIQELGRLTGTDPASQVIGWVERRVNARGTARWSAGGPY